MYQYKKLDGSPVGEPGLCTVVTFHPFDGGAPIEQPYGMGRKSHLSYMPDPDTGKSLVEVPGGPGSPLPQLTNWHVFVTEMANCDPIVPSLAANDLSVLDGMWAHIANKPEPVERQGFGGSLTSDAGEEQRKGPKMIPVVTEIKDDGKPWEGGGGFPEVTEKPKAKKPPIKTAPGKAPAKPAPMAAKKPNSQPTQATADAEEAVLTAAQNGLAAALEKNPNGCPKVLLRTAVFTSVKGSEGEDMAKAVADTFFSSDDALKGLLSQVGYDLKGPKVVPA